MDIKLLKEKLINAINDVFDEFDGKKGIEDTYNDKDIVSIVNDLEKVNITMETWKNLLPETLEVKDLRKKTGFIYKPVYGRVGEKISIKEACKDDEYQKIIKDVKKHPKQYLAQKKFESLPLKGEEGKEYHVCLGSYIIEGEHAGYYARISEYPRIDSYAADIPVLIEK